MSHHDHDDIKVPKPILYAAGAMMLATLFLAGLAQTTGIGKMRVPEAKPIHRAEVRFETRGPGELVMLDGSGENVITEVAPGEQGFVGGVLRSLERSRKLDGLPADGPYVLTRWEDGRLSLADPSTGEEIQLIGFGDVNLASFARLQATAARTHDDGDTP